MTETWLAWIDIETTGLDPDNDYLLEVHCRITDTDCTELATFHQWAALPDGWRHTAPEQWPVDQVVLDMHTRNGLWADLRACGGNLFDEDEVVDDLVRWIDFVKGDRDVTIHPAGSGVARFDIPWLKSRVDPELDWPLHHREFDISGMRMAYQLAGYTIARPDGPTHRAERDVRDEIDEYLLMRSLITPKAAA